MNAKAGAQERFTQAQDDLIALSHRIHAHPELGFEEEKACAWIAETLSDAGFRVETGICDLPTAFVARAGSGPLHITICAEYDCLPGIGHACGHNIIAASAVGAGIAAAQVADEVGLSVSVLGTPAEEAGDAGGKILLLERDAFTDAHAAMMVHPSPRDVVDGPSLAIIQLEVAFHGKEAHASAFPEKGINAPDAFVQSYVNLSTLRQHILSTDKIHGIITDGGKAPNIIPALTRSKWYVRSQNFERLEVLRERVLSCFEAAAQATGCRAEIEQMGNGYTELISNPLLTELYAANSQALGRPLQRGADLNPSEAGSTDMGNVSQVVPTIHPMLSLHCAPIGNHQPAFTSQTITPEGKRAVFDGAVGMAWTAIDLAAGDLWDSL